MASNGDPVNTEPTFSNHYVWITTDPPSPGVTEVGNPVANPVGTTDMINPVVVTGTGISQDITTMTNAVPQDEFNGLDAGQARIGAEIEVTGTTIGAVGHVLEEDEEAIIEVPAAGCSSQLPKYFSVSEPPDHESQKKKVKSQRRRLTPNHREMIINLVFNEKKTSREVARYMGLPQSTVMSVVQVFKKEHRVHKKTATGRKRRLTTPQEFQLFEWSQERENVPIDEIKARFLELYPNFIHISKTTIYRTLERGKKGLIGMNVPEERFMAPNERIWSGKKKKDVNGEPSDDSNAPVILEPSVNIMEESNLIEPVGSDRDLGRQRRSLSIAEREMIISLFFNENRTTREVAECMHLAKSTVSSVVQVFKKERRIQRKTSTGRKKKLSGNHEQMIMQILSAKDDITIEETRTKFLDLNPDVSNISKSTIYRIMENCQSKLKARTDMMVFVGTFVHSTAQDKMAILTDHVMGVLNGRIEFMENVEELDELKAEYGFSDSNVHYMGQNNFMMPGLIDTHVHASQFPNNCVGIGVPLLDWLESYTYPTEANFRDTVFARQVYTKVVERLLKNGTTTACYFATIHLEGTKVLADVVHNRGQRAFVGKVNMTRNCPDYYKESSIAESVGETQKFIEYVSSLQSSLVKPIVTPRFAISCHENHLSSLGQLALKYDCHIQSHLCESQPELQMVKELFPWSRSYTNVYDNCGLLTEKTVMAHGVWLSDDEICLIRERNVGIAHCPNSNIALRSGICKVKKLLNNGIKVGLGTDCSGGYSSSMLDAIRQTVMCGNIVGMENPVMSVDVKEAFHMATLGGAQVLNLEEKIGNFRIEKEFDALLVEVDCTNSPIDIYSKDSMEDKVRKFLFNGDDRNIVRVYVRGRKVMDQFCKSV